MSHIIGTVQILPTPMTISAGTTVFNPPAAPMGTKFLLLHFQNLNFQAGDQLKVDLGYGTDIFTASDGPAFWTRPINIYAFPAGVQITYTGSGNVQMDQSRAASATPARRVTTVSPTAIPFFRPLTWSRPTIRSGIVQIPQIGRTRLLKPIRPMSATC
jgi:hypothetical protein